MAEARDHWGIAQCVLIAISPYRRLADLPTCETYGPAKVSSVWTSWGYTSCLGGPVYDPTMNMRP